MSILTLFTKRVHWLLSRDPTTAAIIVKIKLPTIAPTASTANTYKIKSFLKILVNVISVIIYLL